MEYPILFLITLLSACMEGQAAVTWTPKDVATVSGEDVQFNCSEADTTLRWTHTTPGSSVPSTIFLSLDNDVHNPEKYAVSGTYDLTVKRAVPGDGGMYYCELFTKPEPTKMPAKLYVFEPLSCASHQMEIVEGDNVTVFCTSVYGGETAPSMQLSDITSDMVTMVTKGSNSTAQFVTMETSLIVTSDDDERQIVCHVSLDSPEYMDNCTVTLSVLYPPRNVSVYPDTDYFYVGEQIKCNASGNPLPDIQWENLNDTTNNIPSDTITVTSEMMGNNTWRCLATNSINGTTNGTHLDFNFFVGTGVRTTMGPVSAATKRENTFFSAIFIILFALYLH